MSTRLKNISIKNLYPLALAEGEGVGTAYEYYAKRLVLGPWLSRLTRPGPVLIAGLPQKYGSSLDFILLAAELGREVVVADERAEAVEKARRSLAAAKSAGLLARVTPAYRQVDSLAGLAVLATESGLSVSSEVLQRIPAEGRAAYWRRLAASGPAAVFAPNADNPAHTDLSGLDGVGLEALRQMAGTAAVSGYIDMPPFPPGMTRSDDQREQATSGRMEAAAMWGLGWYARLERLVPLKIRRSQAHIVFALTG